GQHFGVIVTELPDAGGLVGLVLAVLVLVAKGAEDALEQALLFFRLLRGCRLVLSFGRTLRSRSLRRGLGCPRHNRLGCGGAGSRLGCFFGWLGGAAAEEAREK